MRILSIGECMVEFFRRDDGLCGRALRAIRSTSPGRCSAIVPSASTVDYLTRIGTDRLSDSFLAFLAEAGIGSGVISRSAERTLGLYTIETDASGERSFSTGGDNRLRDACCGWRGARCSPPWH